MEPLSLKNILDRLQRDVPEINKNWIVVNDSHLGNSLQDMELKDNLFLVGLLPSYDTNGSDVDNYKTATFGQLILVEKTDYSELSPEMFIDVFQRTFKVIEKIRDLLCEYASSGCEAGLFQLDISSLKMDPIYKLSQCNGWSLEYNL